MRQDKYNQIQEKITELEPDVSRYLTEYLKDAPAWLYESMLLMKYPGGHVLVWEGSRVEFIYVLMEGTVKATNYRIATVMYHIMWFRPVIAFGSMEIFLDSSEYRATLQTTSDCSMLLIPRALYERWMKTDANALYLEAKTGMHYFFDQSLRDRVYLFMKGNDRLAFFFMHYYEQFQIKGQCKIALTRQELSDCTGLSLKTINRGIDSLLRKGYISKQGNKIVILKEQYIKIEGYMTRLVENRSE